MTTGLLHGSQVTRPERSFLPACHFCTEGHSRPSYSPKCLRELHGWPKPLPPSPQAAPKEKLTTQRRHMSQCSWSQGWDRGQMVPFSSRGSSFKPRATSSQSSVLPSPSLLLHEPLPRSLPAEMARTSAMPWG